MAVLLEGSLMKRSTGTLKRWQKRYFVVGGHYLKYAANEQAARATPKATIDLHALQSCRLGPDTFITLHFSDGVELELQAATEKEAEGWHEVLAQFEMPVGRKASLLQSLEHYAPRKGTLVFERKGTFEHKTQTNAPAQGAPAAPAASASPPGSPAASTLQQLPSSWSADQVAAWLAGIGGAYANYTAAFIENGIDGDELLSDDFGADELEEFGVRSKVHQKRILKEIKKLR
jgi:acyl transferase domain-containing protein